MPHLGLLRALFFRQRGKNTPPNLSKS